MVIVDSGPAGYTAAVYAACAGFAPVVIAASVTAGAAYLKLYLPEEERLSGHGLSWCATCDGFFLREQHIVVVGGGDSAMEEALFLTRFASKVTIVHRRSEFRASKIMAERAIDDPKSEVAWDSEVAEILGDDQVTGLRLRGTVTGAERVLDATGAFAAGDLVDHTYRQAITAAGTGCAAALDAQHFLSNLAASKVTATPVLEVSA